MWSRMMHMSSRKALNKFRKTAVCFAAVVVTVLLCACDKDDFAEIVSPVSSDTAVSDEESSRVSQASETVSKPEMSSKAESSGNSEPEAAEEMKMFINGQPVNVEWENNASVEALKQLAASDKLTIEMSMYGGFEQVGSIGTSLPREDVQTTTEAGDIVLYSGEQMVVFYGSNSWAYTRLGHITDKTADEMTELLGNGNVTITLSMTE